MVSLRRNDQLTILNALFQAQTFTLQQTFKDLLCLLGVLNNCIDFLKLFARKLLPAF